MAVYYKWVKGCQRAADLEKGLWTYFSWGNSNESGVPAEDETISSAGTFIMPKLHVRCGKEDDLTKDGDSARDLGYVITSKMPRPLLNMDIVTNHTMYFTYTDYLTENGELPSAKAWMQQTANDFIINSSATLKLQATTAVEAAGVATFTSSAITLSKATSLGETLSVTGASTLTGKATLKNKLELDTNEDSDSIKTKGGISATKECSALYFNATSDMRAKENIELANYSALELVSNLPVYNYNYKNNPNERVTGILAQDLVKAQPKDLDLVSNINASGENNDYMSIKNDKLMFVLLKAIQEQQEEIKLLKDKIDILEKNK